MRRSAVWSLIAAAVTATACGSGETRTIDLVRVSPEAAPACGAPADGQTMLVSALGDFPPSEATGRPVNLTDTAGFRFDSFPAETRVLEVVIIGGGGVTRTVGRTAAFDLDELDDGAALPVFMAPPRGFCATGSGSELARARPLAARAGAGVLVAGGFDAGGQPVTEVSLYHPDRGEFESLGSRLYDDPVLGLAGATMTALGDGRVIVAGGPAQAYQLYGARERSFTLAAFLPQARAHHAAVALDESRVLLAAGCASLQSDGSCEPGTLLPTTTIIDLDSGDVEAGPALAIDRIGGAAVREPDGRVLLVGGVDGAGAAVEIAERIDPDDRDAPGEQIAGISGLPVSLIDGGTLVVGGPPGHPDSAAAVIPAAVTAASPVMPVPAPRAGATATALDDGRVLIAGGAGDAGAATALLYEPDAGRFVTVDSTDDLHRSGHAAVALDDGSVLIVGGTDLDGEVRGDAWIFRPDLTGPFSSGATVSFDAAAADLVLVPRDPGRFRIEPAAAGSPAMAVLQSAGDAGVLPSQWALIGGPTFVELLLSARLRVTDGGLAVIAGFVDPGNYAAVVAIPGQNAQLYRVAGGQASIDSDCDGSLVEATALAPPGDGLASAELDNREGALTVTLNGATILTCSTAGELSRGYAGVGAVGSSSTELQLVSVTVGR